MSKRRAADLSASSANSANSNTASSKSRRTERLPAFLERDAQTLYNSLWGYPAHTSHFIASTPVSLERRHLSSNLSDTHVVGEKNDGERKLLLVGASEDNEEKPYIVFMNRSRKLHLVARCETEEIPTRTHFMVPEKPQDIDLCDGTLLDGELMADGEFIVFDCVVAGGDGTKNMPFLERMRIANACTKALRGYLNCRTKRFYPLDQLMTVVEQPTGPCDGLILMPLNTPVCTGRHDNCFKWKPTHKCTVDLVHKDGEFYAIGEGGKWIKAEMEVDGVKLVPPLSSTPLVTNMIYEVAPGKNNDAPWTIVGSRPDKMAANYITTIRRTLLTIRDNIRPEDIR